MFKQHLDQNYDFKKLLGALINPLMPSGLYIGPFILFHLWLNILKIYMLNFKVNPIFVIYVKFAIEWWYGFTYLIKNSLRKRLAKIGDMKKKTQFFENRPGIKGLNKTHCKIIFFFQKHYT